MMMVGKNYKKQVKNRSEERKKRMTRGRKDEENRSRIRSR